MALKSFCFALLCMLYAFSSTAQNLDSLKQAADAAAPAEALAALDAYAYELWMVDSNAMALEVATDVAARALEQDSVKRYCEVQLFRSKILAGMGELLQSVHLADSIANYAAKQYPPMEHKLLTYAARVIAGGLRDRKWALAVAKRALVGAINQRDSSDIEACYGVMAVQYSIMGMPDTAAMMQRQRIVVAEAAFPDRLAHAYSGLGIQHRRMGNIDSALHYLEKAVLVIEELGPENILGGKGHAISTTMSNNVPQPTDTERTGGVNSDVIALSQRFAMLMAEYQQSMEDGQISVNEAKRLLKETTLLQQVLVDMKLNLEDESV